MGLVSHDNNVPALGKRLTGLLKFLHGGEDNAVGLPPIKQRFQVFPAFSLNRLLAQESLAFRKLSKELVIQIIPVCQHNDGRAVQRLLQPVGVKYHRQRFSATLCMPEHSAFAIGFRCVFCRNDSLIYGKILMIPSQYLELL